MIDTPDVSQVEHQLYSRMLRNAFKGFAKSALIGAGIGLALGAGAAALVAFGVVEALPFVTLVGTGGAAILDLGLKWALGFALASGGFGAVAGIQSTRDTRRFLLMHESPELKRAAAQQTAQSPTLAQAQEVEPEAPERGTSFVTRLQEKQASASLPPH